MRPNKPRIVTCDAALRYPFDKVDRDFAVVLSEGTIADSGVRSEILDRWPDASHEAVHGNVMLPGLINAHDHGRGVDSLRLGLPDDTLEVWLKDLSRLPQLPAYETALLEALLLAESGVTWTVHSHIPRNWNDPLPEIDATLRGYRDGGVGVAFHWPFVEQNLLYYGREKERISALPTSVQPFARDMAESPPLTIDEYISLTDEVHSRYHSYQDGVLIQAGPAGAQWCREDSIAEALRWAERRRTRMHMHIVESRQQVTYAHDTFGTGYITHLDSEGLLSSAVTLAHVVWADEKELELLGACGVAVSHNPSSNIRLGSGIAPVRGMLQSGVPVGCGMDGLSLELDHDYLRELRLAYSLSCLDESKGRSNRLRAPEALTIGTRNGFRAVVGKEHVGTYGGLAAGEPADMVILRLESDYLTRFEAPSFIEFLLSTATRNSVSEVFHSGKAVVRDGKSVFRATRELSERLESLRETVPRSTALESILASLR